MKNISIAMVSAVLLAGCNSEEEDPCNVPMPAVIIPAVSVSLFDTNEEKLNVCDAILSVDSDKMSETIYGSAYPDCEETYSLSAGYDLIEHDVLIEKAGYISQTFEDVLPIATQCSYKTLEISVYLEAD